MKVRCVDFRLQPQPPPKDWAVSQSATFVCAVCHADLAASRDDLVYFCEVDHFFHQHANDLFCRALQRTTDGIQIGFGDSERFPVVQNMEIVVSGRGDFKPGLASVANVKTASKEFFDAMSRRGLTIRKGDVRFS
jgi:hypothetical protein